MNSFQQHNFSTSSVRATQSKHTPPKPGMLIIPGAWVIALIITCTLGCESITKLNIPGMQYYRHDAEFEAKKAKHQANWREHQSAESLTWLLRNTIDNGMSVNEVNQAISTEAEPAGDRAEQYKTGANYLVTDDGYRWGPDSNGRVIVLFFRNNQLVNFDPHEIQ
jgi:hypothetical protein